MGVVFFEGFNFNNGNTATLDPNYWTSSAGFSFDGGRTENCLRIPSRSYGAPISDSQWLRLANFTDPLSLAGSTCVGLGFWVGSHGMSTSNTSQPAPYVEKFLELTTSNGTLTIDNARAGDNNGVLLRVSEDGVLKGTYDFRTAVGTDWQPGGNAEWSSYSTALYLDLFFDAANGVFAVRASGGNTLPTLLYNSSGAANTTITPFNSFTAIKFYGIQINPWTGNNTARSLDDLYLAGGSQLSDVYLGSNTRIYRRNLHNLVSSNWASDNNNSSPVYALQNDNGDSNYVKSYGNSATALFSLQDLDGNAPDYVEGVRLLNVARTSGPGTQYIRNMMAATEGATAQEVGPTYTLNTESYKVQNAFFLTNPLTSAAWTKADVNNLVIGIKNKS